MPALRRALAVGVAEEAFSELKTLVAGTKPSLVEEAA